MQILYAFDFDGTLTTTDTLLAFIRHVHGTRRLLWGFLLHAPLLVLMKLHLYPNWQAKQRIFAYFFKGMSEKVFDTHCQQFALTHRHLLRHEGVQQIEAAIQEGSDVAIVSASINRWVQPFFPDTRIIGTEIEIKEGMVTGQFLTPNCYGIEKVKRLRKVFPDLARRHVIAYGDSKGDRELLAIAAEAHYKPFRSTSSSHSA